MTIRQGKIPYAVTGVNVKCIKCGSVIPFYTGIDPQGPECTSCSTPIDSRRSVAPTAKRSSGCEEYDTSGPSAGWDRVVKAYEQDL